MTLAQRLRALIGQLHTVRVGGIGLGTAVASAATILGQGLVRHAVASVIAPHLGAAAAGAANALLDSAVNGASTTLLPAIGLAYAGRSAFAPALPSAPSASSQPTDPPAHAPLDATHASEELTLPAASSGKENPMNPELQAAEKAALAIAVPLVSAGIDKLAADKPGAIAYLKAQGHTVGTLAVNAIEKGVGDNLKGLFSPLGKVIDEAVASGEPQVEALAANQESALYDLGIAFLRGELAKAAALAG